MFCLLHSSIISIEISLLHNVVNVWFRFSSKNIDHFISLVVSSTCNTKSWASEQNYEERYALSWGVCMASGAREAKPTLPGCSSVSCTSFFASLKLTSAPRLVFSETLLSTYISGQRMSDCGARGGRKPEGVWPRIVFFRDSGRTEGCTGITASRKSLSILRLQASGLDSDKQRLCSRMGESEKFCGTSVGLLIYSDRIEF